MTFSIDFQSGGRIKLNAIDLEIISKI